MNKNRRNGWMKRAIVATSLVFLIGSGVWAGQYLLSAKESAQPTIAQPTPAPATLEFVPPKSPQEAVKRWAEAVRQRAGRLEYALFDESLKKQLLPTYEENEWVIGTSTPWIDGYTIEWYDKAPLGDRKYNGEDDYLVTFRLADTSGIVGSERIQVSTRKYGEDYYLFEKVVKEINDNKYLVSTLTLPDGSEVIAGGRGSRVGQVNMQLDVRHVTKQENGYSGEGGEGVFGNHVPNTSYPVEIQNVDPARIYEFRGTKYDPEQNSGVFFLVTERADPQDETKSYVYVLNVQFTGDQKAAQDTVVRFAANWKLP